MATSHNRVLPFSSQAGVEHAFRVALQQQRKSPSLIGLSNLSRDIDVALFVAPTENLRELADSIAWELALLGMELNAEDRDVARYEDVMASRQGA